MRHASRVRLGLVAGILLGLALSCIGTVVSAQSDSPTDDFAVLQVARRDGDVMYVLSGRKMSAGEVERHITKLVSFGGESIVVVKLEPEVRRKDVEKVVQLLQAAGIKSPMKFDANNQRVPLLPFEPVQDSRTAGEAAQDAIVTNLKWGTLGLLAVVIPILIVRLILRSPIGGRQEES